jgi:hypothetical protein
MSLQVDLTLHRHTFALEKIRDDVMNSTGFTDYDNIISSDFR